MIPAQVFGIPLDTPRSAYQDLSVNVGTVLNNIAATVANGSALTIPIDLPYPLGDTTMTVRPVFIPGTAGVTTPGSDPGSQDSDGISVSGGLVDFRIHLLDPSTGKKIELPVLVSVKELQPKALDVQCSRRGLPQHSVKLLVHERVATFAIAAVQNYDSTGLNVLDPSNLLPAELLAVKVLGQKIKISVNAGPITIGNPAGQIITLSCPQASKSTDCINASQPIGGANGGTALTAADQLVSSMRLSVEGLPTTNTPLDTALIVAVQLITDSLNTQLKTALNLLAAQIIPLTEGVNISVVPTTAFLDSVNAPPPTLYAQ